jgi:hypothetical protein
MIYFRPLIILIVLIPLCACASGPVNDVDFNEEASLKDLSGTYENKMGDFESSLDLFSTYLWSLSKSPTHKGLTTVFQKHIDINYINITYADSVLLFEAISNDCVVVEKTIEINERFEDGQFKIKSSYGNWSQVHIGPMYNRITLGIDIAGDAKLRSLDRIGGLAFWVVPFAIFESRDHRINRLAEKQIFPNCGIKDYWSN